MSRWEETIAAIDAAASPSDAAAYGGILLQLAASEDGGQERLAEAAYAHPKVPAAVQRGASGQQKLVGKAVGWDAVASAWCRFYDTGDPWDQWAEQLVIGVFIGPEMLSTESRWDLVLRLLEAAPNERVLGIIGASPIEDLLSSDPDEVVRLIERDAPQNRALRIALRHTWKFRAPEDVFARVKGFAEPDE